MITLVLEPESKTATLPAPTSMNDDAKISVRDFDFFYGTAKVLHRISLDAVKSDGVGRRFTVTGQPELGHQIVGRDRVAHRDLQRRGVKHTHPSAPIR